MKALLTMPPAAILLELYLHTSEKHGLRCALAQFAQANHIPCDILFHITVHPVHGLSKALAFVRLNDNPFVVLFDRHFAAYLLHILIDDMLANQE